MNSLHVDNIANIAYANCKILNQRQDQGVSLCFHNNTHVMSQPEWDDFYLAPEKFIDENNFYLNDQTNSDSHQARPWVYRDTLLTYNHPATKIVAKLLPLSVKNILRPFYLYCWALLQVPSASRMTGINYTFSQFKEKSRNLADLSKKYPKIWHLSQHNFYPYFHQAKWLKQYLTDRDIVFAYSISPIYSMLVGDHPYIAYEVGTLRDIPFEKTILGKSLALAYRLSPHLLITNPDVKQKADELGITRYSFCPHPVDEDIYKPVDLTEEKKIRSELLPAYKNDFILFAPARQNWGIKGNHKMFSAYAKFIKTNPDSILIIPGWGQEVTRSKNLCKKLRLDKKVVWLRPLPEQLMIKYFQLSDVVLDQFQLGVFGLITSKAMACGKPVITSYNQHLNNWCFREKPPIFGTGTAAEINTQLNKVFLKRDLLKKRGKESRDWMIKYHSKNITADALINAAHLAREYFKKSI